MATHMKEPHSIKEFEELARCSLPGNIYQFTIGGEGLRQTMLDNVKSFRRYQLVPRFMEEIQSVDSRVTCLGNVLDSPICLAPSSLQKLVHSDGEGGMARAANSHRCLLICSQLASTTIEEVAHNAPNAPKWMQLYLLKPAFRELSLKLVRRAEQCGFEALVLTVDQSVIAQRRGQTRFNFQPPVNMRYENLANPDGERILENPDPGRIPIGPFCETFLDSSLTWKDVDWLKSITKLPVVLKGILTAEDAVLAVKHGVAGIIVSNHGGR